MLTHRSGSSDAGLFVASAMERESSLLKKQIDDSASLTFHTIGIGPKLAYQGIRSMLGSRQDGDASFNRPPMVLLLGFAGAVDASLKSGDLVLSNQYRREALTKDSPTAGIGIPPGGSGWGEDTGYPDSLIPNLWMHQQALESVQSINMCFTSAPSLTVGSIIGSPAEKWAIWDQYSVSTVNMEDYWAAAAAKEAGAHFLSVRAVLDVSDQRLPGYLSSMSASGSNAIMSTLARPWRAPELFGLAIQMKSAQRSLARFALSFIPKITSLPSGASLGASFVAGGLSLPLENAHSVTRSPGTNPGINK